MQDYFNRIQEKRNYYHEHKNIIKNIHEILMENLTPGGIYRYEDVIIIGASHKPPSRTEMHNRLSLFYHDLLNW